VNAGRSQGSDGEVIAIKSQIDDVVAVLGQEGRLHATSDCQPCRKRILMGWGRSPCAESEQRQQPNHPAPGRKLPQVNAHVTCEQKGDPILHRGQGIFSYVGLPSV
jgi:hypothetical protein